VSESGLKTVFGRVDVDGAQSADMANGKLEVRIPCAELLLPTSMDRTLSAGIGKTLAVAPIVVVAVDDGREESAKGYNFFNFFKMTLWGFSRRKIDCTNWEILKTLPWIRQKIDFRQKFDFLAKIQILSKNSIFVPKKWNFRDFFMNFESEIFF
jgi:hypothetical protein